MYVPLNKIRRIQDLRAVNSSCHHNLKYGNFHVVALQREAWNSWNVRAARESRALFFRHSTNQILIII